MAERTGKTSASGTQSSADDIRRAFSELPFEQQISTLIRIELDMLGNAVDTVVSATSRAIDDIANACSNGSASATPNAGSQPSTGL